MRRSFECFQRLTLYTGQQVRCGKCEGCRCLRAWLKKLRMELEAVGHDGRVWLCTLTFKEAHTDEEGYPEVQRWLKAVRSFAADKDGGPLRYTCVVEHGAIGGRLHYHVVLYAGPEVKWRWLNRWSHGYAHFKLVPGAQACGYVTKYLAKGTGKVRSSTRLGESTVRKVEDNAFVKAIQEAFPGAEVVRISGVRIPRELHRPSVCPDEEWRTWTYQNSTPVEGGYSGMDDAGWQSWLKRSRQDNVAILRRRPKGEATTTPNEANEPDE